MKSTSQLLRKTVFTQIEVFDVILCIDQQHGLNFGHSDCKNRLQEVRVEMERLVSVFEYLE